MGGWVRLFYGFLGKIDLGDCQYFFLINICPTKALLIVGCQVFVSVGCKKSTNNSSWVH